MERELKLLSGLKKNQQESLDSLLEYFRGNAGRLDYCGRLAEGRMIGSGLIEGACKNLGEAVVEADESVLAKEAGRQKCLYFYCHLH